MGAIIKAICQCGFESNDISVGGGFSSIMNKLTAPAFCNKCKSLVVQNCLSEKSNNFYEDFEKPRGLQSVLAESTNSR